MEKGNDHGLFGRFRRLALAHGRRGEVEERLGDGPIEKADADAGREHHRGPREDVVFRLLGLRPEPDVAIAAEGEIDAEDQRGIRDEDQQPAEAVGDPGLGGREDRRSGFREEAAEENEPKDQNGRRDEDRRAHMRKRPEPSDEDLFVHELFAPFFSTQDKRSWAPKENNNP